MQLFKSKIVVFEESTMNMLTSIKLLLLPVSIKHCPFLITFLFYLCNYYGSYTMENKTYDLTMLNSSVIISAS